MANEQQKQPQQQQVHPAAAACEFMQRTDLKGGEVEVFAQTFNWLQQILQGEVLVLEKEFFETMQKRLAEFEQAEKAQKELAKDPAEDLKTAMQANPMPVPNAG